MNQIQTLITNFFIKTETIKTETIKTIKTEKKIYGYNETTNSWHCLECGDDMGTMNPRQLCGKYYCCNN